MTNQKLVLSAEKRSAVGKKAKQLRKQGITPANIFGMSRESQTIQVNALSFRTIYKQAHETGVIFIEVESESIPTLVSVVEHDPISQEIIHVDFRRVNLKQKIETTVPVVLIGESEAVKTLGGDLLTLHDHLTVEALPQDIPSQIEIDISALKEIGDEIKVSDIAAVATYTLIEEPDMTIVSVAAHEEQSLTPETTSETPEVIGEAETGEAAAEGEEAPAEASSEEPAKE